VDFLQFYAAARFVADGHLAYLYDWGTFASALPVIVPAAQDILFLPVYPPQLALLFSPLARLSYLPALAVWTLLSVGLYVGGMWKVWRRLPALHAYPFETWCFVLGFMPFLQLVSHGQVASLAMPFLAVALRGFQGQRPLLVGLALGSLVFKPQLGTFALAALALWPSARLATGLALGAGVQLAMVAAVVGYGPLREYLGVVQRLATSPDQFEPNLWAMHSLRGAVELAMGQTRLATACWLAVSVGAVWLARRAWARHASLELRFAVIALVGLLLNPHLYVYDLVLMAVPLACLASWAQQSDGLRNQSVQSLGYALVWLPLLGPLAATTHIQLTSPVVLGLLWRMGCDSPANQPSE